MSRHRSGVGRSMAVAGAITLLAMAGCRPWEAGAPEGVLLHPNGDVLAAGTDVRLSDTIPGDAMAAGRSVRFEGAVGGSYVGAGADVAVRGRSDGSVRAAGGTVRVGASVGRNVTLAGGSVDVEPEAAVERNAYLAGGTVRVEGSVDGDLYVGGREVTLNGYVGGDVRVEAKRLVVGPRARLSGDLRYRTVENGFTVDPRARIDGERQALPAREERGAAGRIVAGLLRVLAFVLTGLVVVALLPATAERLMKRLGTSAGAALGLGLLSLLVVPLGALIATLTLLGLPLALIACTLFVVAIYLAPLVPALWVGGALLGARGPSARRERVEHFLLGGPLVGVAIVVPWVGIVVRLLAVAAGMGALALLLFRPEAPVRSEAGA